MPATRKLSVRPDAPMWAVYLVNGKMATIEIDMMYSDPGHVI
jgi:hypothetical protein